MFFTLMCTMFLSIVNGAVPIAGIDLVLAEAEWKEPEQEDVEFIAKTIHGEAGICDDLQKSAVAWCILNRVDWFEYPSTVKEVVTQPYQFKGYNVNKRATEHEYWLAYKILWDWLNGVEIRRTLPREYLFFHAENGKNVFTTNHRKGKEWDWSLPYLYEER